jgi:hypothetical protein
VDGVSPDQAAILAAMTRIIYAVDRISASLPRDEAGTDRDVQHDLDAARKFLRQVGRGT